MNMDYHITVKGEDGEHNRIASFENEADRDVCLPALTEFWFDAEFKTEDDS